MSSQPPARVVPVLLYHSVCSDPAPLMREWAQTPARFREHLAYLRDEGYTTLTLSEYAYVRPACHVVKAPEELDVRVVASATC